AEIVNGTAFVLREQISMPSEDLVRETANLFGFQRTGRAINARISEAIEQLIQDNKIREDSGRLVYAES
ncbi:MAG: hypothetical protein GX307_07420, partial [Euryarchaeota archaeon]|nr:hypothetical protein [Euryarchaeota archaeon]